MKKILLSFLFSTIAVSTITAQESSAEKLHWKDIANNSFWSNWELSLGAGANYTAWDKWGFDQGDIGDWGWQVEAGLTKWFNPIVGARLEFIGGKLNSSDNNSLAGGYILPHGDAVLNLSNWIGGYREHRTYYAKLFAGAGYCFTNVGDNSSSGLAVVGGLINTFRISQALDINLEFKGVLTPGRNMPRGISQLAGKNGQIYSITAGVAYRFNKRDWDRAYTQQEVDGYLAAIAALEVGLAEAQYNQSQLTERLAAQRSALEQALQNIDNTEAKEKLRDIIASTAIFFNINSYRLSDRAKSTMQLLAQSINEAPKEQVFTIVGHADEETGTPAYNQKLSEKRAKAVYNHLVELGINPDRLTWKGVGSTENIFPINNTNRVVIVK